MRVNGYSELIQKLTGYFYFFPEFSYVPPLLLGGTACGGPVGGLGLARGGDFLAPADAFLGFTVEQLRLGGRAADVADALDDDGSLPVALLQADCHANLDGLAGLGADALAADLAALDGLAGNRPGLVEARGPKPFVEPHVDFRCFGWPVHAA